MAALNPWLMSGIILVALTAVLAIAFLWTTRPPRPLDAETARTLLYNHDISTVVDVRTTGEYNSGHYHSAIHIPVQQIMHDLPRLVPDRSTSILFYCRTGHRAAAAARAAQHVGYTNVWYLTDSDWHGLETRHTFQPS